MCLARFSLVSSPPHSALSPPPSFPSPPGGVSSLALLGSLQSGKTAVEAAMDDMKTPTPSNQKFVLPAVAGLAESESGHSSARSSCANNVWHCSECKLANDPLNSACDLCGANNPDVIDAKSIERAVEEEERVGQLLAPEPGLSTMR